MLLAWSVFKLDRDKPRTSALNFLSFWSIASMRKGQTGFETFKRLRNTKNLLWFKILQTAILTMGFFAGLILFPHLSGSCFEVSGSWKCCKTIFFFFFPLWFWFCLNCRLKKKIIKQTPNQKFCRFSSRYRVHLGWNWFCLDWSCFDVTFLQLLFWFQCFLSLKACGNSWFLAPRMQVQSLYGINLRAGLSDSYGSISNENILW